MKKILTVGYYENVAEAEKALDEGMNALTPDEREKAEVEYHFDPMSGTFKVMIGVKD